MARTTSGQRELRNHRRLIDFRFSSVSPSRIRVLSLHTHCNLLIVSHSTFLSVNATQFRFIPSHSQPRALRHSTGHERQNVPIRNSQHCIKSQPFTRAVDISTGAGCSPPPSYRTRRAPDVRYLALLLRGTDHPRVGVRFIPPVTSHARMDWYHHAPPRDRT